MFIVNRSERNPIISPTKDLPWEASAVFNWCPVKIGKTTHVVYRAMPDKELLLEPHQRSSVISHATSKDGVKFENRRQFIVPEHDFERFGCEDPRVTELGGTYYIFYTALSTYPFSAEGIKVAVALSKDMKKVSEKHLVTPFNAKAMALFPEKINGKLCAILTPNTDRPPSEIAYAEFTKPEEMWDPEYWNKWYASLNDHVIPLRRGNGDQVEVGAPPVKTKKGWLLIYSHISRYTSGAPVFGFEAVLLDLKNPRKIIGRTKNPFMVPESFYELHGYVPNVIFPTGALIEGNTLDIYYGGADTHCAKASVPLDDLLDALLPDPKNEIARFPGNPVITPREGLEWEAGGTLNPGAIELKGKVHLLYRACTKDNYSTFGYASSKDCYTIENRLDKPVYVPREDFEGVNLTKNAGCEDPRLVEIGEKVYMTYTAYNGSVPRVAITSMPTSDFIAQKWEKWSTPKVITEPGIPNKDACLFPEKIGGKYYVVHRVATSICMDILSSLDFDTEKINRCIEIVAPRRGMWDDKKVGLAGPPIKTALGWIMLYHGIGEDNAYRVGAVLLDLKQPIIVKGRTALPIFEPKEEYELNGVVGRVVFPCGTVMRRGVIYIYYGAADSSVCVATIKLATLLDMLTP